MEHPNHHPNDDWIALVKAQLDPEHTKRVRAQGAEAFADGREWSENPYARHELDYGQWGRGWLDAEMDTRRWLRPVVPPRRHSVESPRP